MQTIIYILPELFLSIVIMLLLMIGVFIKKSFKLVNLLTVISLLFAIILVLNQPNEIVFRSLIELFSKVGNKYYQPRGKSVVKLLSNFGSGKIKKINISGCILEKVNNSFIIYKEN